ncbi:MAG: GFA family protein [Rubrivivax sp.]|nr:GFA family protein [Rubrivivax sp.]
MSPSMNPTMSPNMTPLHGTCQCGSVRFTLAQRPIAATACHCVQCRKQSGHFFASANLPKAAVTIAGAEHLTWYASSPKVRRGFCSRCGSWLFWEPVHRDWTSVALGALDGATGVTLERHIFVAEMGDYYTLADGLPQNER